MNERIFKVLSQIMGVPIKQISIASSPETIDQWDSLKHLNLVLALEEEFNIRFDSEHIVNMQNVGNIMNTIEGLTK